MWIYRSLTADPRTVSSSIFEVLYLSIYNFHYFLYNYSLCNINFNEKVELKEGNIIKI